MALYFFELLHKKNYLQQNTVCLEQQMYASQEYFTQMASLQKGIVGVS